MSDDPHVLDRDGIVVELRAAVASCGLVNLQVVCLRCEDDRTVFDVRGYLVERPLELDGLPPVPAEFRGRVPDQFGVVPAPTACFPLMTFRVPDEAHGHVIGECVGTGGALLRGVSMTFGGVCTLLSWPAAPESPEPAFVADGASASVLDAVARRASGEAAA